MVLVRIDLHFGAGKVVATRFFISHYFRFNKNFTNDSTRGPTNKMTGTTIP